VSHERLLCRYQRFGKTLSIETGSRWTLTWILPTAGNVIVIAELTVVEMASLLARMSVTAHSLRQCPDLASQLPAARCPGISGHATGKNRPQPGPPTALSASFAHPGRGAAGVGAARPKHLGQPLIFAAGDMRLLTAAAAEGFVTDDPNAHP